MAVTLCEQALQSDWPAKRAGGERMRKQQPPAHRSRVSFHALLAHDFSECPPNEEHARWLWPLCRIYIRRYRFDCV